MGDTVANSAFRLGRGPSRGCMGGCGPGAASTKGEAEGLAVSSASATSRFAGLLEMGLAPYERYRGGFVAASERDWAGGRAVVSRVENRDSAVLAYLRGCWLLPGRPLLVKEVRRRLLLA